MRASFIFALVLVSAVLGQTFTMTSYISPKDIASSLKKSFLSFEKPEDLYYLFHEAMLAKVVSEEGDFYPARFVEVAKSLEDLYKIAKNANIIVLNDQFSSAGLVNFVKNDLALYNMLIKIGVLDKTGAFDQAAFASILQRYNPNTKTLDPLPEKTKEEEEASEEEKKRNPVDTPLADFKLESVQDVYKLVLKAYQVGIFDKDGNFIEAAFAKLMRGEQYLAQMLRNNDVISFDLNAEGTTLANTPITINYDGMKHFVDNRPSLLSLLTEANVYAKFGNVSKKAISDIIFRYNEQTGKLDLTPLLPVVEQMTQDEDALDESTKKQMSDADDVSMLPKVVMNLFKDPITYLRDFLVLLRKHAVLSSEGDFDAFAAYQLFSADSSLKELMNTYKLFDETNTAFNPTALLTLINGNKELKLACESLGVLINNHYNQDAVAAIVEAYRSKIENADIDDGDFTLLDPVTAKNVDDVYALLAFYRTVKVIDDSGNVDVNALLNLMEHNDQLKNNILRTGVLINTNTISSPRLRQVILEHPLLRNALTKLGVIDTVGELDATALVRAIARATNRGSSSTTTTTTTTTTTDTQTKTETKPDTKTETKTETDPEPEEEPEDEPKTEDKTSIVDTAKNAITEVPKTANNTAAKAFNATPVIIGVAVGLLALIAIIVAVVVIRKNKKKKLNAKKDEDYLSV